MTTLTQILMGTLFLALCSTIHIVILAYAVKLLKTLGQRFGDDETTARWIVLAAVGFATVVLSHTIQLWIWAIAFVVFDALPDLGDAIYFALVTYTTLGYGDVTVGADARVFAAMAAVTGLLNFGLSTAFLVGLVTRLFFEPDSPNTQR